MGAPCERAGLLGIIAFTYVWWQLLRLSIGAESKFKFEQGHHSGLRLQKGHKGGAARHPCRTIAGRADAENTGRTEQTEHPLCHRCPPAPQIPLELPSHAKMRWPNTPKGLAIDGGGAFIEGDLLAATLGLLDFLYPG